MLAHCNSAAARPELLLLKGNECVLVIIDMQDRYEASRGRVVQRAVAREILAARQKNWWIMVLEFGGTIPHSPTHPTLTELLKGYTLCLSPLIKYECDGSKLVKSTCCKRLVNPKRFRVCGVNIGGCVHATVDGLVTEFGQAVIEVVKKACNCTAPDQSWQHFMQHPRLAVI